MQQVVLKWLNTEYKHGLFILWYKIVYLVRKEYCSMKRLDTIALTY